MEKVRSSEPFQFIQVNRANELGDPSFGTADRFGLQLTVSQMLGEAVAKDIKITRTMAQRKHVARKAWPWEEEDPNLS